MSDLMNLSLRRKQRPVMLENEDGELETYVLCELTGKQRDEYLTRITKKVKVDKGGNPMGSSDLTDFQAFLISKSLYKCQRINDEHDPPRAVGIEENPVSIDKVRLFPASAQEALFEAAQELSALGKGADEEAKNESDEEPSNTDG